MLSEKLYITFNAGDAVRYYEKAGEQLPHPSTSPDELQRVLARQANRLFVLDAHVSMDTAEMIRISLVDSNNSAVLRCYDRDGERHPQTRKPLETRDYVVSHNPPPNVVLHGDINFWLDSVETS